LPHGYHLTEEDREAINRYMDAQATGDLTLAPENARTGGRESRETAAVAPREKEELHLIRSRLPMKAAFRMGCGALKHKKFRLVITILLSCIAFGLFGLTDTFGSYDHVRTLTRSLMDSGVKYASVMRQERIRYGDKEDQFYWRGASRSISEADLAEVEENTGVVMQGVFVPGNDSLDFVDQYDTTKEFTQTDYHIYAYGLTGFAEMDPDRMKESGCTLVAGRLPADGKDEIAVSAYLCETFYIGGYTAPGGTKYTAVKDPGDMVGKVLRLAGRDLTVVGVVDTGVDLERYRHLTVAPETEPSSAEQLIDFALYNELMCIRNYSYAQIGLLSRGTLNEMKSATPTFLESDLGWLELNYNAGENEDDRQMIWAETLGRLSDRGKAEIRWLNGERTTLGEKEVVVSAEILSDFLTGWGWKGENDPADPAFDWEKAEKELNALSFRMDRYLYGSDDGEPEREDGWRIVGVLMPGEGVNAHVIGRAQLVPDSLFDKMISRGDGVYRFAVGQMPATAAGIESMVRYFETDEGGDHRFVMQNPVTYELDSVHEVLLTLAKVFFWIGVGFAFFAAVMLGNFIATSINYKKQEIGILRAIGARSNDVFRIFFSESFVIAVVNFILSAAGTFGVTALINYLIRSRGRVLITVLTFGPRQILLILATSLLVAAVASFLPVRRIASKRPIDAIRNR
ncbi:MAG: ABC transporter permease, partial [Clostridia bacterium]|nr:ABC transporter permease [Clostridia bacterium]